MMLAATLFAHAEQYDEVDLLGRWDVTSFSGEISTVAPGVGTKSFTSIYFGAYMHDCSLFNGYIYNYIFVDCDNNYHSDNEEMPLIEDFFISNGNKLHIIYGNDYSSSMRFVIKSFSDDRLVLENYEGTCHIELKKAASGINAPQLIEKEGTDEYYNLNGIRISNPDEGLYIKRAHGKKGELIIK